MSQSGVTVTLNTGNPGVVLMGDGNASIDANALVGNNVNQGFSIGKWKDLGYTCLKHYDSPEPCDLRKGGPGSKVHCEVYETVPHTTHTGRGPSGKWFTWKDDDEEVQ